MSKLKSIVASVVCASLVAAGCCRRRTPPPRRCPSPASAPTTPSSSSTGAAAVAAIVAAAAASAPPASSAPSSPARSSPPPSARAAPSDRDIERCDEDFPDFDPQSGTYIDRNGDERVCPYLRLRRAGNVGVRRRACACCAGARLAAYAQPQARRIVAPRADRPNLTTSHLESCAQPSAASSQQPCGEFVVGDTRALALRGPRC